MSALAHHHTVIAVVERADGTVAYGDGWTGSIYCTLDEIGARKVMQALCARFPGRSVRVQVSRLGFDATVR